MFDDANANRARLYHVIAVNDSTGTKTYLTCSPVTHDEGCTILRKIPDCKIPRQVVRKLLEEVSS